MKNIFLYFLFLIPFLHTAQTKRIDSLRQEIKGADSKKLQKVYTDLGLAFQDVNIDSAIVYADLCVKEAQKLKDPALIVNSLLGQSFLYTAAGEYKEAHNAAFAAQHIADSLNIKELYTKSSNSIGYIYAKYNNQREAIRYYLMAIKSIDDKTPKSTASGAYNNIGNAYMALNLNDSALMYLEKSLELRKEQNDVRGMSYSYNNMGNVYVNLKDFKKADEFYRKSLELKIQIGDKRAIVSSYCNLAIYHLDIGDLETAKKEIDKAVSLAEEIKVQDYLHDAYDAAIEIYTKSQDYKTANDFFHKIRKLDKKLFDESMTKQITEMQAKYESVKQKSQIDLLQKDKERQKYLIYFAIAALAGVLLITFFIYRGYSQKHKSNELLKQKNEIIESRNKDILDSITYAKRLQTAVLPTDDDILKLVNEYFLFFQPRDIVSGDFYFIEPINTNEKKRLLAFAVADCTGHGVPGAFMSMLGFDILKNSLTEKHVNSASEALDYLNGRLTRILRTTSGSQVRDGMDIAFCVLDPESLKLYFSGANNPCWIIKKDKTFAELKPDKQPIGFFEKSSPFTLQFAQLEHGDMFYLFTDGFADQFGGPKGKKFKYKQLKDLLSKISDLPMNEQREAVSKAFMNWKGNLAQTDDVCIIGIRAS
jgi:serine phosphatase RsbU (regulator of sigma subunit)/Tfp pilus assembly protein PilF